MEAKLVQALRLLPTWTAFSTCASRCLKDFKNYAGQPIKIPGQRILQCETVNSTPQLGPNLGFPPYLMADPVITLSEEECERLRQDFRDTFAGAGYVNHTSFIKKCIELKHCTQEDVCTAKTCKAISHQTRRSFLSSTSVRFRQSTVEVLCKFLYQKSYFEWKQSIELLPPPAEPQQKTTSRSGFVQIHSKVEYYNQAVSILQQATEEVWLYDYSLEISLSPTEDEFLQCLHRGVSINVLFLNPESEQIPNLARLLNEEESILRNACKNSVVRALRRLKQFHSDLESRNKNYHRAFNVRVTEDLPRLGAYLYDPEKSSGKSFFLPSVNRVPTMKLPIFEFQNLPEGVSSLYMKGIRKEWAAATTLHSFLTQNPHHLEEHYPTFFLDYPEHPES
ncbi:MULTISPECIES: DUF5919 domain-containing protein [Cyanophyceae]|uniref:DUF5919 domain-containing protein n=1 Tax=Leptolyngbya subtilissima DQ-A4 TaxID=2933933 RepID=A0ABV0KA79_9CYAN|nr:DUF5919 domain-containing protein [Nodosilinea sp. FACHB-141]MBD2115186.1 hypothetical protein [Nodosilinea sp. FACHB-141]